MEARMMSVFITDAFITPAFFACAYTVWWPRPLLSVYERYPLYDPYKRGGAIMPHNCPTYFDYCQHWSLLIVIAQFGPTFLRNMFLERFFLLFWIQYILGWCAYLYNARSHNARMGANFTPTAGTVVGTENPERWSTLCSESERLWM